jgi:RNase adapter protein RapZ
VRIPSGEHSATWIPVKLSIVSGLSGSGKSTALNALEDQGLYCIDNLPLALLSAFAAQMLKASLPRYQHAAVGIDARNLAEDFGRFPEMFAELRALGIECEIIFLDAQDDTLLKRFSETRRKHPLSSKATPLLEAIRRERQLLEPLARHADLHVDTTHTNVHQLRQLIQERVGGGADSSLSLLFQSFGYKHGVPPDADFVFDVRCLPNPHWDVRLRARSGLDPEVVKFLEQQALVQEMYEGIREFLDRWIAHFEAEHRTYLTVALGCTGGQHRSVYLVERLANHFRNLRGKVLTRHREIS